MKGAYVNKHVEEQFEIFDPMSEVAEDVFWNTIREYTCNSNDSEKNPILASLLKSKVVPEAEIIQVTPAIEEILSNENSVVSAIGTFSSISKAFKSVGNAK